MNIQMNMDWSILDASELPQSIENVNAIKEWHNKVIIDEKVAIRLGEMVDEFCIRSLNRGVIQWNEIVGCSSKPEDSHPTMFHDIVLQLNSIGSRLIASSTRSRTEISFESIADEILTCYEQVHALNNSELKDSMKFFLEFSTGLHCFLLVLESFRIFIPLYIKTLKTLKLVPSKFSSDICSLPKPDQDSNESNSFGSWNSYAARLQNAVFQSLITLFSDVIESPMQFSGFVEKAYNAACIEDPDICKAHRKLLTLRYVPKSSPEFLSAAQHLHWNGFGGNGSLLKRANLPLDDLIAYAPLHREGLGYNGMFDSHQLVTLFFVQYRIYYTKLLASVMLATNKNCVKVFEDGAGNHLSALNSVTQFLKADSSNSLLIDATVADVSGHSIASILKIQQALSDEAKGAVQESAALKVSRILFRDLMTSSDFNRLLNVPELNGNFDVFLISLVLHQVSDSNYHDALIREFRFAVQIVIDGGVVIIGDPTESDVLSVHFPINLVDREGFVPKDIVKELGLKQLAVQIGESEELDKQLFKVAVPVSVLSREFSRFASIQVFYVVSVSQIELDLLDYAIQSNDQYPIRELLSKTTFVDDVYFRLTSHLETSLQ